ncbi:hypothetical protein SLEP1_g42327 [Rubroshorea leprosula]|uniref:Uncharacterized protein n=1 Tax=Rubroshorea leprosula TaxID=152421 RepID=A0AAV5LAC4_9ROSI|nr:hypothetical protein SLEP1_g42327 [Rubroshorea leprosula]
MQSVPISLRPPCFDLQKSSHGLEKRGKQLLAFWDRLLGKKKKKRGKSEGRKVRSRNRFRVFAFKE